MERIPCSSVSRCEIPMIWLSWATDNGVRATESRPRIPLRIALPKARLAVALGRFGDPFDFRRGDLGAARLQDVTHLGKIERTEFIQFVRNREAVLEQFVQTFAGPGSYHKEGAVGKSVPHEIGLLGHFGREFVEGIDQNYNPALPSGNRFQEFLEGLG